MFIDKVEFELIEDAPVALQRWKVRVRIEGHGLEPRSAPLVITVGDQNVEMIVPLLGEDGVSGVQGLLPEIPTAGEELRIGHADTRLVPTGFEFSLSEV
jgi:hypothetical protein